MKATKLINRWADDRFFNWVDKRSAEQDEHLLTRHNLYIFPTPMGLMYLSLAVLIWLLGTNYQNNLILSLSYLQISMLVVAILHTYFNMAGLRLRYIGHDPVFAGELLNFKFHISTINKNGCDGLSLSWHSGPAVTAQVEAGEEATVLVGKLSSERGLLKPKRLLVESRFPLGLIRCWSWLKVPAAGVVYPKPIECAWPNILGVDAEQPEHQAARSGDEFFGFTHYQHGDALRTVAWKHYARGRGLVSKQFAAPVVDEQWLDFQLFHRQQSLELTLSQMCFWVQQWVREDRVFGVRLPGFEIAPGAGDAHYLKVLHVLATYEVRA